MDPSMLMVFGEAVETGLNKNIATEIVAMVKEAATLFDVFPINYFLYGSLIVLGLTMFRRAKGVAKS